MGRSANPFPPRGSPLNQPTPMHKVHYVTTVPVNPILAPSTASLSRAVKSKMRIKGKNII